MEVAVRTLNLDIQTTRPVCTPGSLINKFFCFDTTVVLLHQESHLLLPLGNTSTVPVQVWTHLLLVTHLQMQHWSQVCECVCVGGVQ